MQSLNETAHKLLDVAEHFTQTRGFNAFSYKDLQQEVGVKTSSIHYYFPTKQDLAASMMQRYVVRFREKLQQVDGQTDSGLERLQKLGSSYVALGAEDKFCLCGMLSSDSTALPDSVNQQLRDFFDLLQDWIAQSIELAIKQSEVASSTDAVAEAAHYLAALEGGLLIARIRSRPDYLQAIVDQAITSLKS